MLAFRAWMVGVDFNRDPFATPPNNANPIPGTTPRWRNAGDPVRSTVSCHLWVQQHTDMVDLNALCYLGVPMGLQICCVWLYPPRIVYEMTKTTALPPRRHALTVCGSKRWPVLRVCHALYSLGTDPPTNKKNSPGVVIGHI